jgi:hypothetical protein
MVGNAGNKRIRGCPQTHLLCRNTVRVAETALDAATLGLFLSSLLLLDTGDFDRRTILKGKKKKANPSISRLLTSTLYKIFIDS